MMLRPKIDLGIKDLRVSETESFLNDNIISFEEIYQNYAVGIVDVVNSTIISRLYQEKVRIYYNIFFYMFANEKIVPHNLTLNEVIINNIIKPNAAKRVI